MAHSHSERKQNFSVNHQTNFHMNPKTNGDFTEPLFFPLITHNCKGEILWLKTRLKGHGAGAKLAKSQKISRNFISTKKDWL